MILPPYLGHALVRLLHFRSMMPLWFVFSALSCIFVYASPCITLADILRSVWVTVSSVGGAFLLTTRVDCRAARVTDDGSNLLRMSGATWSIAGHTHAQWRAWPISIRSFDRISNKWRGDAGHRRRTTEIADIRVAAASRHLGDDAVTSPVLSGLPCRGNVFPVPTGTGDGRPVLATLVAVRGSAVLTTFWRDGES